MAELTQAAAGAGPETLTIWRALINWLLFFFQVFLQIVRTTPSMSQVLSFIGVRHPLLSSSSSSSSASSSTVSSSYKPVPIVELPLRDSPPVGSEQVIGSGIDRDEDQKRCERLTEFHSCRLTLSHCQQCMTINSKKTYEVVLDLDETLVCAYDTSSLPSPLLHQATEAGLKWFELECVSSDKEYDGKPKVNHVTVFERPRLQEFLKQSSEFADLVLFTAGLEGYACPLVDRIDVGNCFRLRLYRPSTISTRYREHVKDLSYLSRDLSRTVIVDNNPFSFLLQPLNGIPCLPFSAGQPYDDQLMDVLLPLLKHLSTQNDVRPVLYERFHMPEWFEKHGIPASNWAWK